MTTTETLGDATHCTAVKTHAPVPLRYVWHHVLPEAAGGKTNHDNCIPICDNCHYGVHALMYDMAQHDGHLSMHLHEAGTPRYRIARQGYEAAKAADVLDRIPNEGEVED